MVGQIASIQTDGQNVIEEYEDAGIPERYYIHGTTYVDEHILMSDLDKEHYYLLGALYSVVGLADENGDVVQRYSYDAYGLPTLVAGDFNGDRAVDLADLAGFVTCRMQTPGESLAPGCGPADFDKDNDCDLWDIIAMQLSFDSPKNPYLFTGRRLDFDIRDAAGAPRFALYHYRNRAYDPIHGRFLQRDPAGYVDGMNLYEYVRSRPTRWVDPGGSLSQGTPPILTGPPYVPDYAQATARFLEHYMLRSGQPLFLSAGEADEVMNNTPGVELAIDNELDKALGKAENLPCHGPGTVRGQHSGPVAGLVRAEGVPWRVIIQHFTFKGTASCSVRKTCACCQDASSAYRTYAECHFDLTGQDTYNFHTRALELIPGVPYNILWTWQTDVTKNFEKKCRSGATPDYPWSGGGGAAAW